jgi:hypothetical protein
MSDPCPVRSATTQASMEAERPRRYIEAIGIYSGSVKPTHYRLSRSLLDASRWDYAATGGADPRPQRGGRLAASSACVGPLRRRRKEIRVRAPARKKPMTTRDRDPRPARGRLELDPPGLAAEVGASFA